MRMATDAWRCTAKSWLRRDASMTDYRGEFYGRYEIAVGARQVDQAHYDHCARQFGGRWGAWLPPDKDIHILDIGCGYGEFLYFLRSLGYRNIVGLDLCKGELRSEEHTSELQSLTNLVCRLLLEKKKRSVN